MESEKPGTNTFLQACRERTILGDGAMGTELQRAGLEPGTCGELWTLDKPDRIEAIHRAYIQAGSQAIITCSFGANRWVLGRYGLADKVEAVNRAAASIARRSAAAGVTVLGDIGPFGGFLRPLGEVEVEEVAEAFEQQALTLLAAGADGIIIETMSALEEIVAAVGAARRAGARFVIASMAFERRGRSGLRTMMGIAPGEAAKAVVDAGADIVGANCGTSLGPSDLVQITATFKQAVDRPVIIQPNAGQPELVDGRAVYRMSPEEFASLIEGVVAAGASVVGGCCGTTPAHIAAVRDRVGREGGKGR
jgi:5-methyltetrahydrofolate--homocysteine methyltransferase